MSYITNMAKATLTKQLYKLCRYIIYIATIVLPVFAKVHVANTNLATMADVLMLIM